MSNVIGFTTARKTSRGNLLAGWLGGGKIEIYNAPKAATSDTAISTQTLLVTFILPDPAATVSNGILTGEEIDAAQIAETGNALWCRVYDGDDVAIGDGDVGLEDSGSFIEIDNLSLVQGGYCSILSFGITEG